ncbi:hypothetical protein CVT24_001273 [Panaeolus cyanescens]|uniref:Uncharacterized protein n=1 Tax=Panaeolus cyanescens TaxID=181874 RepID=A0A409YG39_9AGAR|nr:hypothetical protein CVT24_001273 [Panaeolus cyanescens]
MRPLIRCRWGTDCRNRPHGTCTFVHPDEPEYQTSRESSYMARTDIQSAYLAEAKQRPFSGFDRQRAQTKENPSGISAGNRTWGNPPTRSNTTGSSRPHSGSGDWGQQASGNADGGWNTFKEKRRSSGQIADTPGASSSSSTSMWPTSWDAAPTPASPTGPSNAALGGWGAKPWNQSPQHHSSGGLENTERGVDAGTQLSETKQNEGNPWGNWGAPKSDDVSKNANSSNVGWGSFIPSEPTDTTAFVDKGKGRANEHMQSPASPAPPVSSYPTPARPAPSTNSVPFVVPPIPSRKPRVSSNLVPDELKTPVSVPQPTRQRHAANESKMKEVLLRKEAEARRKAQSRPPDYYKGPEGRRRLYAHLIRVMVSTASVYSRMKRAETYYQQVRTMMASPQYGRLTMKTRSMFNTIQKDAKRALSVLETVFQDNIEELAIIPDFRDKKAKQHDPRKLVEKVISYTAELQEWFQALALESRVSVEKPVAPKPPKKQVLKVSTTFENPPASVPPTPSSSTLTPKSLYQRGDWTWNEIKATLALMQSRFQETDEEIHSNLPAFSDEEYREDLAREIDQRIQEIIGDGLLDSEEEEEGAEDDENEEEGELEDENAKKEKEIAEMKRLQLFRFQFVKAVVHMHETLEQIDDRFREDIKDLGQLLIASNDLKIELNAWRNQRQEMESVCTKAHEKLSEMETWNMQATDQLETLKEKARQLTELRDQVTKPEPPATPQFDFNELLDYIRPLMQQRVRQEVEPALEKLLNLTVQYQQDMSVKVDELVQPAKESTNKLVANIKSSTST